MTQKTAILVNGETYELTDCCHWKVRNGILWNCNTGYDEGVDGDLVEYTICGAVYKGHVKGYTCYQFIETEEWGKVVLSVTEYQQRPPVFTHHTKVQLVQESPMDEDKPNESEL